MGRNTFGLEIKKPNEITLVPSYPVNKYKVVRCAYCDKIKKSDLKLNGKDICFQCATKKGYN
jgi:formylmethanofuran dehydrogenase subunit E